MIAFNIPPIVGKEEKYIKQAIQNQKISGGGQFNLKCNNWFEENFSCRKALVTTSGTHALEMAALLIDIKADDEVIMPSFTFSSTANAFALRGAKIVFVDIKPDTMNIDEELIEEAITEKTKAIVPVHYAGVSCEMDKILSIAEKHELVVIEDAAQGVMSEYKDKYLGTIGDIGCYSFHESKNYTCGEGGAILINKDCFLSKAEIIMEKGTDRANFFRGQVDKYTWVDLGSSYVLSEINAAYLYAQLEQAQEINIKRLKLWNLYYQGLAPLAEEGHIELPSIPEQCNPNAHLFYIKTRDIEVRVKLISYLKENGIISLFHYIPLHSSKAGKKYGSFYGADRWTTRESERLVRLPLYYGLESELVREIINNINRFYK
ncbi:MAG: dTDP-4-amino-4,6-dideoxygalactose transaminase [Halanaerobiales bacterium]|nr:dTDP-4-amino-4,6-dideoxygalactose transaminase [Halanaerobiales bacterium]